MSEEKPGSLLVFPCDFTIKVFGNATEDFESTIVSLIRKHLKVNHHPNVSSRVSENGKYLALSITIPVESQAQLDKIYQELTSSPLVLMAL